MERRTAVITGASSGLGLACAGRIAADPAWHVVLAVRDARRGESAVSAIRARVPGASVEVLPLDNAELASVRRFADLLATGDRPPLGALVCNAAVQVVTGATFTRDGLEETFQVNHLAHQHLASVLAPRLAPGGRVVFVASGTHDPDQFTGMPAPRLAPLAELARPPADAEDPGTAGRRRYTTSKLLNVMAAYELQRRLRASGTDVEVHAFDPGLMPGTGLARDYGPLARAAWSLLGPIVTRLVPQANDPETSAAALARLAVAPAIAGEGGRYWVGEQATRSSKASYDEAAAARLWADGEALLAELAAATSA